MREEAPNLSTSQAASLPSVSLSASSWRAFMPLTDLLGARDQDEVDAEPGEVVRRYVPHRVVIAQLR